MIADRDVLLERIEWMMRLAERGTLSTDMRQELTDLVRGLSKAEQIRLVERSYRRGKDAR